MGKGLCGILAEENGGVVWGRVDSIQLCYSNLVHGPATPFIHFKNISFSLLIYIDETMKYKFRTKKVAFKKHEQKSIVFFMVVL